MSEEISPQEIPLKHPEPEVSSERPWKDDELGSQQFAESLTNLVSNETGPLTISLDGHWGTGKTFLLKRWQKDLEKKEFKSIYFNAWEDDFCTDPLVAIIGQLSNSFQSEGYKKISNKIKRVTKRLLTSAIPVVLKQTTGIPIPEESLKKLMELSRDSSLDEYLKQIERKEELKKHLKELSDKVKEETKHPLVFIIDELDRCRPTFAIELLERVKHIFDIPNIIFVFGINRDELLKALESVYGEIKSDVYLRRFFDMEFLLPETDSKSFCSHLITKYKLDELFSDLSKQAEHSVHREEFQRFSEFFPRFCRYMDLSLRDIDYCVRAMVFAVKKVKKQHYMYPDLTSILIVLRLQNPPLYRDFKTEKGYPIGIMNYIHKKISMDTISSFSDPVHRGLTLIEAQIYAIYQGCFASRDQRNVSSPLEQLKLLQQGKKPTHPEYLSEMIKKLDQQAIFDQQAIGSMIGLCSDVNTYSATTPKIDYIFNLIELVGAIVQR